ncbi:hypothetical protein LTR22_011337 [Elasticomyces elasticus]|nr:hypothetical protein LTR22_011337 [Elasticomyces elasticus]KAK5751246.1 hypothetical protein LTS12_018720 [Elasticomyces elasticus]
MGLVNTLEVYLNGLMEGQKGEDGGDKDDNPEDVNGNANVNAAANVNADEQVPAPAAQGTRRRR